MTIPHFTAAEERTRATFLALMWAMSYPGRAHELPSGEPFALIAETLLDLEVTYYVPDSIHTEFAETLKRSSSRPAPLDQAAYILWPDLNENDIPQLSAAKIGTMLAPDTAATLIISVNQFLEQHTVRLTGPGIQSALTVNITLPPSFWELRERTSRFPLGWDVILVTGEQVASHVMAIPRSTKVEYQEFK